LKGENKLYSRGGECGNGDLNVGEVNQMWIDMATTIRNIVKIILGELKGKSPNQKAV